MLNERQTELLKLIVEDYIKTARPIGSKQVCEQLSCSSATIRNEMSNLENLNLLEKTHTSSGRIPSEKGYRYYVDNIMVPKELNGEDFMKLQQIFHNNSLVLTDAIVKSMEIVSQLTSSASIVLGNSSKDNLISKIEVVPLDSNNFIAIIITNKGYVEHKKVYIEEIINIDEVKGIVEIINKHLIGSPVSEASAKLEFEVKPVIGNEIKQKEMLYNAFYNAFTEFGNKAPTVKNTSNMLKEPEFDDSEKIRKILDKFESKEKVNSIKEDEDGVHIYIGSENEFDEDMTVIKTKYTSNNEEGTIALIGPKRMEYDKAITLLNYIVENIERK